MTKSEYQAKLNLYRMLEEKKNGIQERIDQLRDELHLSDKYREKVATILKAGNSQEDIEWMCRNCGTIYLESKHQYCPDCFPVREELIKQIIKQDTEYLSAVSEGKLLRISAKQTSFLDRY